MKVYNKGVRPIVYKRSYDGIQAIQPKKHLVFGDDEGKKIIAKYENAVSEKDYEAYLKELEKAAKKTAKE